MKETEQNEKLDAEIKEKNMKKQNENMPEESNKKAEAENKETKNEEYI